jgi:DNA-binding NarL/FixJ family response regulator
MIRILIVDDHPLVREGLSIRLATVPHFDVVGEASSAEEALRLLDVLKPHLVLSDIGMKGINGVELTRTIVQKHPGVAVLILSMFEKSEYVQQAMQAGARGYIVKEATSAQIIGAIESVARGGTYLSMSIAGCVFGAEGSRQILSTREEEILGLIAKGQASKQIARTLDISVRTVESHRQSIRRKLNLDGQAALVKFAVERQTL